VARTLVHLVTTTGAETAGRAYNWGILRGQSEDVGTNVVGAPNPATDFYEDWAWLEQLDYCEQSGAGPNFTSGGSNVRDVDIHSRRRLPELHMSWNIAIASAIVQDAELFVRTLIMLP